MSTLDASPDFDGIRDVLDSLTSTSGGSGSVAMNETDTRNRVTRKNGSAMAGNGTAPNYNPGTSTEARQMLDFKNTFRMTTSSSTPTYTVPSTKSSVSTSVYGWGTRLGNRIATTNNLNASWGSCWTGSTNHTTSNVNLGPYGISSCTLESVGKHQTSSGTSVRIVTNTDPGSSNMATFHVRSWYTNGITFPAGTDTRGGTGNAINFQYSFTSPSDTGFLQQYGGGIYISFASTGIPSSASSAFAFSFLPS